MVACGLQRPTRPTPDRTGSCPRGVYGVPAEFGGHELTCCSSLSRLDATFLSLLFSADAINATASGNLSYAWTAASQHETFSTPALPDFSSPTGSWDGLSLALWLDNHTAARPGQALIDLRPSLFLGIASSSAAPGALILSLEDSAHVQANVTMDAECTQRLLGGGAHYVAATVDVSAQILSLSVDGVVCDGGDANAWGWAWVPPTMGSLDTARPASFVLGGDYAGFVRGGAWYSRRLLNTEVAGNFRHQVVQV